MSENQPTFTLLFFFPFLSSLRFLLVSDLRRLSASLSVFFCSLSSNFCCCLISFSCFGVNTCGTREGGREGGRGKIECVCVGGRERCMSMNANTLVYYLTSEIGTTSLQRTLVSTPMLIL